MLSVLKSTGALAPVLAVLLLGSSLLANAQAAPQLQAIKSGAIQGKQIFASTCAGCHGLDGRGSERAPNIADGSSVQRLSDPQIARIIENGVPGTGMPAFHALDSSQVKAVVAYLRTLQGTKTIVKLPGDLERGKAIFFGKAGCSSCHMVGGEGGFIASDLSEYGRTHAVDQIRDAILKPAADSNRQVRLVTVTIRGGEKYVGRVRAEDNFSLQLQTLDGAFHFMSKSDLESLEYATQTLMPSDFGSRLASDELNDLVGYLLVTANAGITKTPARSDKSKRDEE